MMVMSFLESSLGFVTNKVANRLRAELATEFAARGFDITPDQWSVLARLCEQDGISQNELSGRLAKDKTNIARMIELMERKGLVQRRSGSEDRRQQVIYLTSLGRRTYQQLVPLAQAVLERATQGISNAEVMHLIAMLNRVYDNLS
jgi:DNA-binding MarR family transcriptional regulator